MLRMSRSFRYRFGNRRLELVQTGGEGGAWPEGLVPKRYAFCLSKFLIQLRSNGCPGGGVERSHIEKGLPPKNG